METLITIAFSLLLITATVIPYFRRLRKKEQEARRRFESMKISGLDSAATMHPHIDVTACIGCGGCVDACPEGDVLGVVHGKAVLIHGAKCVGHGLCAEACPVEGITMMMAPPGRSANLPVLTPELETTVPGIFIAGELGGMGLIRNAVTQGVSVVDQISRRGRAQADMLDVVIVGAGPGGLSAGLRAKELGLRSMVLEQQDIGGTILQYPRRKVVLTAPVQIPLYGRLNFREASKEDLLATWLEIISKTGLAVRTQEKVMDIRQTSEGFDIISSNENYRSRHVVLALGRRGTPRKLNVPGEELPKVSYRLIDAESYQDADILIVGGGDSAVEAALALCLHGTNRVTLSYRQREFSRIKERNARGIGEATRKKSLTVLFATTLKQITSDAVILQTQEADVTLRNSAVFVFAGGELPFEFLHRIGITFHTTAVEARPVDIQ